jgi:hypothetical protein
MPDTVFLLVPADRLERPTVAAAPGPRRPRGARPGRKRRQGGPAFLPSCQLARARCADSTPRGNRQASTFSLRHSALKAN